MTPGWLNPQMQNRVYEGTADTEEPRMYMEGQLYVIFRFLTVQRVGAPTPALFKGQL